MYPFRLGFLSSQTHLGFLPKAMRMGRKRELAPGRRPKKRGRPFAMTPRFRRSKKVAKKGDGFDGFGTPAPPLCVEGNGGSPPTSGSWSVQIRSKDLVDAKNPNDDANMVSVVARKELVFNAASMPNLSAMQLRGSFVLREPKAPAAENPNDVLPRRSCRSLNGCGKIFCFVCYP